MGIHSSTYYPLDAAIGQVVSASHEHNPDFFSSAGEHKFNLLPDDHMSAGLTTFWRLARGESATKSGNIIDNTINSILNS